MELKIKKECDQCGTCISVCVGDALYLSDQLYWTKNKCTFCLRCIEVCPFGAIEKTDRILSEPIETAKQEN